MGLITTQAVVVEQDELKPGLAKRMALFNEDGSPFTGSGEASPVAAADITDSTTVGRGVLTAADAAAARTAIGAGTSSVTLPTTATAAELQAGTVTATRMVSPKLIYDEIARQIAAAAG